MECGEGMFIGDLRSFVTGECLIESGLLNVDGMNSAAFAYEMGEMQRIGAPTGSSVDGSWEFGFAQGELPEGAEEGSRMAEVYRGGMRCFCAIGGD